jgi:hypothetical protein
MAQELKFGSSVVIVSLLTMPVTVLSFFVSLRCGNGRRFVPQMISTLSTRYSSSSSLKTLDAEREIQKTVSTSFFLQEGKNVAP